MAFKQSNGNNRATQNGMDFVGEIGEEVIIDRAYKCYNIIQPHIPISG